MADEVEIALGSRFLARRDVKAVQYPDGHYEPDRSPWRMSDLRAHVSGAQSFGHYLVGPDNMVKVIVFDIDLTKDGYWIPMDENLLDPQPCNPREVWLTPDHPGRAFLTLRLRTTAEVIGQKIVTLSDGEIHVAIAYSGSKGFHVYGFLPDLTPAAEARKIAFGILRSINNSDGTVGYRQSKGDNFWIPTDENKPVLEIEVYPKQDIATDLGNLVRLPLGINRKSGQRAYFLDCRCSHLETRMLDPLLALGDTLPWDV